MRRPAAPYFEDAVRDEVEHICHENSLPVDRDRFGNVFVRLRTAPKLRPLALAAHMDHPGFRVVRSKGGGFTVRFHGGVPDAWFRTGTPIRLMPGGMRAKLGQRLGKEKTFAVQWNREPNARPAFAVWDLPDFEIMKGRIYGRACDDLIGVACILATLIELKRSRARVNVLGIISRAEEVGFHGALAVTAGRAIPKNALVLSLETSRELPGVRMAAGVILRVGDRTSVFDSEATRFLTEVAAELKRPASRFQFQRALMSGGTCEATAYQEFGFQSAAVCVALGNYHNCGASNRIRAEFVSIADAVTMVQLLVGAARKMVRYTAIVKRLADRLARMRSEAIFNLSCAP
jgi:endoglucanase